MNFLTIRTLINYKNIDLLLFRSVFILFFDDLAYFNKYLHFGKICVY